MAAASSWRAAAEYGGSGHQSLTMPETVGCWAPCRGGLDRPGFVMPQFLHNERSLCNVTSARYQQKERLMKAIVIGGGIGGMAAALSLQNEGIEVEVYEQASALAEI